jgi:hypothetical protein
MRTIDIHAHGVPGSSWNAADSGAEWPAYRHETGDGAEHRRQRRRAHGPLLA